MVSSVHHISADLPLGVTPRVGSRVLETARTVIAAVARFFVMIAQYISCLASSLGRLIGRCFHYERRPKQIPLQAPVAHPVPVAKPDNASCLSVPPSGKATQAHVHTTSARAPTPPIPRPYFPVFEPSSSSLNQLSLWAIPVPSLVSASSSGSSAPLSLRVGSRPVLDLVLTGSSRFSTPSLPLRGIFAATLRRFTQPMVAPNFPNRSTASPTILRIKDAERSSQYDLRELKLQPVLGADPFAEVRFQEPQNTPEELTVWELLPPTVQAALSSHLVTSGQQTFSFTARGFVHSPVPLPFERPHREPVLRIVDRTPAARRIPLLPVPATLDHLSDGLMAPAAVTAASVHSVVLTSFGTVRRAPLQPLVRTHVPILLDTVVAERLIEPTAVVLTALTEAMTRQQVLPLPTLFGSHASGAEEAAGVDSDDDRDDLPTLAGRIRNGAVAMAIAGLAGYGSTGAVGGIFAAAGAAVAQFAPRRGGAASQETPGQRAERERYARVQTILHETGAAIHAARAIPAVVTDLENTIQLARRVQLMQMHPVLLVSAFGDRVRKIIDRLYGPGLGWYDRYISERVLKENLFVHLGPCLSRTSQAFIGLADYAPSAFVDPIYDGAEAVAAAATALQPLAARMEMLRACLPKKLTAVRAVIQNASERNQLSLTASGLEVVSLYGLDHMRDAAKDVALVAAHDGALKVLNAQVLKPLVYAVAPPVFNQVSRLGARVAQLTLTTASRAFYQAELPPIIDTVLTTVAGEGVVTTLVHRPLAYALSFPLRGVDLLTQTACHLTLRTASLGMMGSTDAVCSAIANPTVISLVYYGALLYLFIKAVSAIQSGYARTETVARSFAVIAPDAVTAPVRSYLDRSAAAYADLRAQRARDRETRQLSRQVQIRALKEALLRKCSRSSR